MRDKAMTYGDLDQTLRSLGFTAHTLEGKARVYQREGKGATIILPDAPFGEAVLPHHLILVRTVLKEHDISDATDPALQVPKVS